jgi:hypothetical protein
MIYLFLYSYDLPLQLYIFLVTYFLFIISFFLRRTALSQICLQFFRIVQLSRPLHHRRSLFRQS